MVAAQSERDADDEESTDTPVILTVQYLKSPYLSRQRHQGASRMCTKTDHAASHAHTHHCTATPRSTTARNASLVPRRYAPTPRLRTHPRLMTGVNCQDALPPTTPSRS